MTQNAVGFGADWLYSGNLLTFNDPANGFYLLQMSGLGMPNFTRFTERSPLQDGITDAGYRLNERRISIILGFNASNLAGYYSKRRQLINIMRPDDIPGTLQISLPNGNVWCIDGYLVSGLEYSGADRTHLYQKTAIVIQCPDPTFYDPVAKYLEFGQSGGGDNTLLVPMPVPMFVGASSFDSINSIHYLGTEKTYPQITITGPVTDLKIENITTGDKLDFAGVTIAGGEEYVIDLRPGYKTVTDSNGVNKIADLTADSDLSTFNLAPAPTTAGGLNQIKVSGLSTSSATNISMQYFVRQLGI